MSMYICAKCGKPLDYIEAERDGLYYHKKCLWDNEVINVNIGSELYKKGDNTYNAWATGIFIKHREDTGRVYYVCRLCHATIRVPLRAKSNPVLVEHVRYYHENVHKEFLDKIVEVVH